MGGRRHNRPGPMCAPQNGRHQTNTAARPTHLLVSLPFNWPRPRARLSSGRKFGGGPSCARRAGGASRRIHSADGRPGDDDGGRPHRVGLRVHARARAARASDEIDCRRICLGLSAGRSRSAGAGAVNRSGGDLFDSWRHSGGFASGARCWRVERARPKSGGQKSDRMPKW
jgi:hypothetical protein